MSEILRARISDVRGRLRRVHLLAAISRCVLALLGLTAAFFVIDWLALSRVIDGGAGDVAARAVMLLAVIAVFAWVAARTVVAELRTRRSDDAIAMRVERRHPQLRGRLISTVQLTRGTLGEDAVVSQELIAVLEQETVGFAEALDFGSIIDRRTLARVGAAALALLALALALGWWRRDYADALLARLALTRSGYPTAASILRVTPGTLAAYGDPFAIEVELDPRRRVPEAAAARIRPSSGPEMSIVLARVADAPAGRALFRGELPRALEDFAFRPTALDARWPTWERVRVVQRPLVKELSVTCEFPAYLGLAAQTTTVGDLRVPVGTVVKLRAVFTKPVASAMLTRRLVAAGGKDEERSAAMALDGARGAGEASFTVDADGRYAIALRDGDGLENGEPIAYAITALPDHAPAVTILSPAQDKVVTRFARRPIRFAVSDDHGISKAWIRYLVGDADAGAQPKSVEVTGVAQQGEARMTREILVDLSKYGLVEGSRMTWWIEVADNHQPEPNVGASKRFAFTVVDMATMTELLEQEKTRLVGELETLHDKQQDVHEAVETVRQSAAAATQPSGDHHEPRAP